MPLPSLAIATRLTLRPDLLAPGLTEFTAGLGSEEPIALGIGGDAYLHRVWYPENVNYDVDGTAAGDTGFRYAGFPGLLDVGESSAPLQNSVGQPLELETLTAVLFRVQRRVEYAAAPATTELLSTGTTPTDGDTFTLGAKTYTAKTTLTPTEGQILIGGSAAAFLLNCARAINDSGTDGTHYSAAAQNPDFSAAATVTTYPDGTLGLALTARTAGTAGNALATTETAATLSFPGATAANGLAIASPPVLQPLGGTVKLILENGLLPGGATAEALLTTSSPGLFLIALEEPWTPETGAALSVKFDPEDTINAIATITLIGNKPV